MAPIEERVVDVAGVRTFFALDDAGHWPWIERPDCIDRVVGFLEQPGLP